MVNGPARSLAFVLFVALCVITVLLSDAPPGAGQEVLTNDAVIAMLKAGLPETVILAKIRSSQTRFNTSTDGLIALKQAGVPDKILEAMVIADSPPSAAPPPGSPVVSPAVPATTPTVNAGPLANALALATLPAIEAASGRGSVYHLVDGKYVEITPNAGEIQTNTTFFFGSTKSELVLRGRRASYRVKEGQPAFYSSYSASELHLVRLKPGDDHDDRNLKIASGSAMPYVGFSQRHGVRAEDRVEVSAERDQRGWYRITPREVLKPGEYGFVLTHGFGVGATTGQMYDFGVD